MKFCSYKFVLNKAPNNNDVTHIANIEEANSNDTVQVANNVCLTTMGVQQF